MHQTNTLITDQFKDRHLAIIQLESLGELALPAVPALERLVDEGDTTISWQSSDAIFEITGDDSSVIRVGKRLLDDPRPGARSG